MKKLFKVAIPMVLATGLLFSCANDSPASSNPPASQDEEKNFSDSTICCKCGANFS